MPHFPPHYEQPKSDDPLNMITTPGVLINFTSDEIIEAVRIFIKLLQQGGEPFFLMDFDNDRKLYLKSNRQEIGGVTDMDTGEYKSFGMFTQISITTPYDD